MSSSGQSEPLANEANRILVKGALMTTELKIDKNLCFSNGKDGVLTADVYSPTHGDDLPAVLMLHGGGFESGSKEKYQRWGEFFAGQGYVAIALNYRLATVQKSIWPGVADDVTEGVDWVVANANRLGLDPMRIGIIGDSAGAHLAALHVLTHPVSPSHRIRAAVCVYGVFDLVEDELASESASDLTEKMIGGSIETHRKDFEEASPAYWVESAAANINFDTRFLLIWGGSDRHVAPSQSESFAARLESVDIPVERLSLPDVGHLWFNELPGLSQGRLDSYPNDLVADRLVDFLRAEVMDSHSGNFSDRLVESLKPFA